MPETNAADLARLREGKQWSTPYLAVHKPDTMWTGTTTGVDYVGDFDLRVRAGTDDGTWAENNVFTFAPNALYNSFGRGAPLGGGPRHSWYRFEDVQIPRYATVTSATVRLYAHANGVVGTLSKIYANDVADAVAPLSYAEAQALVLTTESVDWDPAAWNIGTWYTSPGITDVIQEIVNQSSWSSGNHLMLVHKDDGSPASTFCRSTSFDSSPALAPVLEVTYTPTLPINQAIVYDNGGALAGFTDDVFFEENATLWVGTTAGNRDRGIVRAKSMLSTWPHTEGAIRVAENSDIQWGDGLYLTLKDEHRVWPRFPRVSLVSHPDPTGTIVTWFKDYDVEYSDQNIEEPPVPIMGPPGCAFIDDGVGTLEFWGEDSYSPRDHALPTGTWVFPEGTPGTADTFGTEAAPHNVTWDEYGSHTIRLRVIDENGKVSYGYRTAFIFDRTGEGAPYTDFEIKSLGGSFSGGGWTASFRVFAEANVEDFPEGAQVVVFSEDWYGGEKRSIGGYSGRENIVYAGWIKANSVRKEAETGEITFETHGTHGELQNCPSFPISVERVIETPDNWNEIYNMNLNLAAFHIGYWHSTLYEVADVLESDDTRGIKYMDAPEAPIYQQLDRSVWGETILARTLVDRQGRVKYDRNPQYIQPHERGELATVQALTDDDWLGVVDIKEVQEPRVSWVDASGVKLESWEKVYPVFSMAPGMTPKPDGSFTQVTNLLVTDQRDVNQMAGYALANANRAHPDRTTGLASVTVPMQGNYRNFDIVPQEWVLFPSLDTLREAREVDGNVNDGTPWPTGTRFIPRDISLGFDNSLGGFMTSLGLEPETIGPTGTSVIYPGQLGSGNTMAVLIECTEEEDGSGDQIDMVFVTEDVFADNPTWARRHNGLDEFPTAGGHNFKVNAFEVDPFSNGYDSTPIQALIGARSLTDEYDLIYHNADLHHNTAWTSVLTVAQVLALAYAGVGVCSSTDCLDIQYDCTTDGYACAVIYNEHSVNGTELLFFESEDHGLTWTFVVNISTQVDGAPPGHDHTAGAQCMEMMDPFDPNYLYMKARIGATDADWCWLRSPDKGETWTIRMGGATNNTVTLRPEANSDDAYYDAGGQGWSLGFFNQLGTDVGGNEYSFAIRYPGAGLGQGVTINSAYVIIPANTAGQLPAGHIHVTINGIDESWLPTFTTRTAFNSWGTTAATVAWNDLPTWVGGAEYTSPNLATVIQELVDRANWDPTCAIGLRFKLEVAPAVGHMRVAYNHEESPIKTPRLVINYDCAALTTYPSVPNSVLPTTSRNDVGVYWGLTPPTSGRTKDGFASRYYWFEWGAGDGPVSMVEPLYGSPPIVYLTSVQGTDPAFQSFVHTSLDGETFSSMKALPVQIAQSFAVWPYAIEGANTLMYVGSRTGDSEAPMDHYPGEVWISEDDGDTWQDKTGNLQTLITSYSIGRDRTERIRLLKRDIVF